MSLDPFILQNLLEQEKKRKEQEQLRAMGINPLLNPFVSQQSNSQIPLGFQSPVIGQLSANNIVAPPRFNDSGVNSALTRDFTETNQQTFDKTKEYLGMVDQQVGNSSSQQIDQLIAEIQAQKANLGKDVSFGTKLLGSALSAVGSLTDNQALANQGYSIIEQGRANLINKKALLDDQEIKLRGEKYKDTLAKENVIRNTYINNRDTAIKFGGETAAKYLSYEMQKSLANFAFDSDSKLKADQNKMDLERQTIGLVGQQKAEEIRVRNDFYKTGGIEAVKIWDKITSGRSDQITKDEEDYFNKISEQGRLEQTLRSRKEELDVAKTAANRYIAGSGIGIVDEANITKNEQQFADNPLYFKFRSQTAQMINASNGQLSSGNPVIDEAIINSSNEFNIPSKELFAMIKVESDFDPQAKSYKIDKKGNKVEVARGLTQFIRKTSEARVIDHDKLLTNIPYAVREGAKFFAELYERNNRDLTKTMINYNMGSSIIIDNYDPVTKTVTGTLNGKPYSRVLPKETINHIAKVQGAVDGVDAFLINNPNAVNKTRQIVESNEQNEVEAVLKSVRDYAKMYADPSNNQIPDIDPETGQPKKDPVKPGAFLMRSMTPKEQAEQVIIQVRSIAGSRINNPKIQDEILALQQNNGLIMSDAQATSLWEANIDAAVQGGKDREEVLRIVQTSPNLTTSQIKRLIMYANNKFDIGAKPKAITTTEEITRKREANIKSALANRNPTVTQTKQSEPLADDIFFKR